MWWVADMDPNSSEHNGKLSQSLEIAASSEQSSNEQESYLNEVKLAF